jgi:hypothetical protein
MVARTRQGAPGFGRSQHDRQNLQTTSLMDR